MFTDQDRELQFENATPLQKELYDGPQAGEKIGEIATKHNIAQTKYPAFAIAIGDVILGLVPQEKLPDLLIERLEITRPEAMKVTADVLDFLAPLTNDTGTNASTTALAGAQNPTDSLSNKINETETASNAVQPIRTMEGDMAAAQVPEATPAVPTAPAIPGPKELIHQATGQDTLLADGPGNQTKNPSGTWDTTSTTQAKN